MAARGMGAATKGGGAVSKTGGKHGMEKRTSQTTGPVMMAQGGEIYTVLGRRVTKEQYEDAGKKMQEMEKDLPADLLEFGKRARERAKGPMNTFSKPSYQPEPITKKKGGYVSPRKKMAMGAKRAHRSKK